MLQDSLIRIGLSNFVDEFINDRRSQNIASSTIQFYKKKLSEFERYCLLFGITFVEEITTDLIRSFLLHLQEKGHNSGGVHTYYRSIKAFLNFYESEFEPENWKNPINKVKSPRVIQEPIEGIGIENVNKLIGVCDSSPIGIRNKTILLLLLETGVRANELLQINIEDVNLIDSSIIIRQGKGRKPRSVFFGSTAKRILRKYLRNLPIRGALFLTREGDRLKYGGLREIIRRLSLKAGIPEQSIHDFRRTFALESLRKGVDPFTISRLMGHTSLQVLSRYLRQTKGDLGGSYKSIIDID